MWCLAVIGENGRWQAGIGDPSIMGWVTVAAYLVAAVLCLVYAIRVNSGGRWIWVGIAAVMLVLGINKQLDLQSLLTQVGRDLSHSQDWYESRRSVQRTFIVTIAAASAAALLATFMLTRRNRQKNWPALAGLTLLGAFVVIRAASFHHVDEMISHRIAGIRMNWVLELGGIAIVAAAALINLRTEPRAAQRASLPGRDAPSPPGTDPAPHASAEQARSAH